MVRAWDDMFIDCWILSLCGNPIPSAALGPGEGQVDRDLPYPSLGGWNLKAG